MKNTTEQRAPLALIAAGGEGKRLGADGPKALVFCAGRSLLAWCLEAFAQSSTFGDGAGLVVVAAHASDLPAFERAVTPAREAGLRVLLCEGGTSRSHSVANALRVGIHDSSSAPADTDDRIVLVHDAARPLVSAALIDGIATALISADVDGLVAAAPATDTIKRVDDQLNVVETPPRDRLWAVQTPQAFKAEVLAKVLGVSSAVEDDVLAGASDDASLIEAAGGSIAIHPWSEPNLKVTGPADLSSAERLLRSDA